MRFTYFIKHAIIYFMKLQTYAQVNKTVFFYRLKKRWLKLRFPLFCRVKGVKKSAHQGALAQSASGDRLQLVHVPSEEYPFQVFVYSVTLNRVLGYLERELSKKLVRLFKKNFCRDGVIYRVVGGGNYQYFGCQILIFESMDMMSHVEEFSSLRSE
jgi:hypothetical protein